MYGMRVMVEEEMRHRVIFTTGGNSGIGLETTLLFAEQGTNVVSFLVESERILLREQ
jgi:NAD(P)-dependent dehydrogenase (short-subunit alcohol dehydrogenase family)